jgi:CheY-like chemotaxis protein
MGYALGASDYLLKPVDRRQLMDTLRKHTSLSPPPTVLVVDDDRATRNLLSHTLRQIGCYVTEAENGSAALKRMKRHRPDLVLLDLVMPVMDGFEFTEEVRKQPRWHDLPIIIVTAKDLSAEDRARLSGEVDDIVHKSAHSVNEFLVEIREMVKARISSPGAVQSQAPERERRKA